MELHKVFEECGKEETEDGAVNKLIELLKKDVDIPNFDSLDAGMLLVTHFYQKLKIQLKGDINAKVLHLPGQGKDNN